MTCIENNPLTSSCAVVVAGWALFLISHGGTVTEVADGLLSGVLWLLACLAADGTE